MPIFHSSSVLTPTLVSNQTKYLKHGVHTKMTHPRYFVQNLTVAAAQQDDDDAAAAAAATATADEVNTAALILVHGDTIVLEPAHLALANGGRTTTASSTRTAGSFLQDNRTVRSWESTAMLFAAGRDLDQGAATSSNSIISGKRGWSARTYWSKQQASVRMGPAASVQQDDVLRVMHGGASRRVW
jgi:hypothetical protein